MRSRMLRWSALLLLGLPHTPQIPSRRPPIARRSQPVRAVITIDYDAPAPLDKAAESQAWIDVIAAADRNVTGMVVTIRRADELVPRPVRRANLLLARR